MRRFLRVVPGRSTGSNERDAGNRVGYHDGVAPDPLDDVVSCELVSNQLRAWTSSL